MNRRLTPPPDGPYPSNSHRSVVDGFLGTLYRDDPLAAWWRPNLGLCGKVSKLGRAACPAVPHGMAKESERVAEIRLNQDLELRLGVF